MMDPFIEKMDDKAERALGRGCLLIEKLPPWRPVNQDRYIPPQLHPLIQMVTTSFRQRWPKCRTQQSTNQLVTACWLCPIILNIPCVYRLKSNTGKDCHMIAANLTPLFPIWKRKMTWEASAPSCSSATASWTRVINLCFPEHIQLGKYDVSDEQIMLSLHYYHWDKVDNHHVVLGCPLKQNKGTGENRSLCEVPLTSEHASPWEGKLLRVKVWFRSQSIALCSVRTPVHSWEWVT